MLANGAENGVIGPDELLRQVAPLKQQTLALLGRWGGGLADHKRAELERLQSLLLLEGD